MLKRWRTLHCVPASNAMTPLVHPPLPFCFHGLLLMIPPTNRIKPSLSAVVPVLLSSLKHILQTLANSLTQPPFGSRTFLPSSQGLMRVKWNFNHRLSSCEHPSKCVSPQSPTEGCGVIPIEGRSICIDPDPGGNHTDSSSGPACDHHPDSH